MRRDPLRDGYLVASCVWDAAIACGVVAPVPTPPSRAHRSPAPCVTTDCDAGAGFSPPVALLGTSPLVMLNTVLGWVAVAAASPWPDALLTVATRGIGLARHAARRGMAELVR